MGGRAAGADVARRAGDGARAAHERAGRHQRQVRHGHARRDGHLPQPDVLLLPQRVVVRVAGALVAWPPLCLRLPWQPRLELRRAPPAVLPPCREPHVDACHQFPPLPAGGHTRPRPLSLCLLSTEAAGVITSNSIRGRASRRRSPLAPPLAPRPACRHPPLSIRQGCRAHRGRSSTCRKPAQRRMDAWCR